MILSIPAGLIGFGLSLGADAETLFRAAGLSPESLENLDQRVSYDALYGVWRVLRETFPDRALGLELASMNDLSQFGIVGAMIRTSPTIGEATRRFIRYVKLIDPALEYSLEVDGANGFMRFYPDDRLRAFPYPMEGIVGMSAQTPRKLLVDPPPLREVRFAHSCFHRPEIYEEFFGAPVRFDAGEWTVVFDPAMLELKPSGADSQVVSYLEALAQRMESEQAPRRSEPELTSRVRTAIASSIREGDASQNAIAKRLAISVRTMQRRLQEEGSSFADLQDEVLNETARALLKDRSCMIHEVAFVLGYSETSSFHRAFKRWTGMTPEQYRKEGLAV